MRNLLKILSLIAFCLFVTSSPTRSADLEPFYNKTFGEWLVWGHPGNDKLPPACIMETSDKDGNQKFQVVVASQNGNLFTKISLKSPKFASLNPETPVGLIVINFKDGRTFPQIFEYVLKDGSVNIAITNPMIFFRDLPDIDKLDFLLSVNDDDANISVQFLGNTESVVEILSDCAASKEMNVNTRNL